ncbi:hypothetical protein [Bacillus sp. FJAT-26390]
MAYRTCRYKLDIRWTHRNTDYSLIEL